VFILKTPIDQTSIIKMMIALQRYYCPGPAESIRKSSEAKNSQEQSLNMNQSVTNADFFNFRASSLAHMEKKKKAWKAFSPMPRTQTHQVMLKEPPANQQQAKRRRTLKKSSSQQLENMRLMGIGSRLDLT